jgi:hypothetical protein
MDYVAVESAIKQQLADEIPGVTLVAFPMTPQEFLSSIGQVQQQTLMVRFAGAQLEPVEQGETTLYRTQVTWAIYVLFRDLRDHAAGFDLLAKVRAALSGFAPIDKAELQCETEDVVAKMDQVTIFGATYVMTDQNDGE